MKKPLMLLVSIIGVSVTLFLSQFVGPVIASAVVGLIGGLLLRDYAGINYAASFAGMSSTSIVSLIMSPILGVLVFIVWLLLEKQLIGVGGKLGTIAFISGIIFSIISLQFNPISNWNQVSIINTIIWTIIGILGTTLTLFVRKKITKNTVIASSLVGLLGGIILPNTSSLVLFSASFAAMSSEKRLKGYKQYATSGGLVGIIFTLFLGLFPGIGGKLGFIGLLSVLVINRIQ